MGIISTSVSMTAVFDGENSVRLSLDNEHEDFLYSDSKELPVAPASGATSQAHLWDGKTEVSASDVTWAVDFTKSSGVPTSGTNKPECVSGLLTVKHITLQTAKVVVKATYPKTNGKDYFAEFTANRTKQDKYDLIVKPSSISYNSATYQPVAISLSAKRTDLQGNVSDVTISTSETLSEGNVYVFWAYVDSNGSIIGEPVNLKGTSKQVSKADAGSNMGVYFELRKYTSGSAYRLCDYETVEIAKAENGEPGKNSIRIDLSNQADLISCDSDGKARFARTITTVARIYDGGTLVGSGATASSATITVIRGGQSVDITSSPQYGSTGATYSWAIQYGDQMTQASYSVNISVTYNNATYNATFTLARTDWEAIYQISASPSAISFKYDSNGDLTPTSENLRLQYSKKTGTGTEIGNITNGNAIDNLLYPYYRIDGGSWYRWTDTQSGAITFSNGLMQVPSSVTWRNIEVCLSTSSSDPQDTNIIDREVIPVVKDGAAGDDGEDAAVAFATPGSFSVPCNADGSVASTLQQLVTFSLKAGTNTLSVTGVTVIDKPSDVTVTDETTPQPRVYVKYINIPTRENDISLSQGVTFEVEGTDSNSNTYTAKVTVSLIGSRKGSTGSTGPMIRGPRKWEDLLVGEAFYSGADGEPYLDIVTLNSGTENATIWKCITTHDKSSTNWEDDEDKWMAASQFDFVATELLYSLWGRIKKLETEFLRVSDTSTGTQVIMKPENPLLITYNGVTCLKIAVDNGNAYLEIWENGSPIGRIDSSIFNINSVADMWTNEGRWKYFDHLPSWLEADVYSSDTSLITAYHFTEGYTKLGSNKTYNISHGSSPSSFDDKYYYSTDVAPDGHTPTSSRLTNGWYIKANDGVHMMNQEGYYVETVYHIYVGGYEELEIRSS